MEVLKDIGVEIGKNNSPIKRKVIVDFMKFLKNELENFEYHPLKIFSSKIYNKAFEHSQKKLKEVNFRPFSLSGPVGSILLKMGHDIDIMILPKKEISSGLLLSACSEFLKSIKEKYEKKFKRRIIIFTFSLHQEEIEELSKRKDDELLIHFVRTCEKFYGKNKWNKIGLRKWFPKYTLFKEGTFPNDIKDTKFDRLLLVLDDLYLFDAEYPPKLLKKKIHQFKYLFKFLNVEVPSRVFKNPRDVYEIAGILIDYFNEKWSG